MDAFFLRRLPLTTGAASVGLCVGIVGDSLLKQKLDNISDTVSDNVRGTGTYST